MINELLQQLNSCADDASQLQQLPAFAGRISMLDDGDTVRLFEELARLADENVDSDPWWISACLTLLGNIRLDRQSRWPGPASATPIVKLYASCPADSPLRCHLLALLANIDSETSVEHWTNLLCNSPPTTSDSIHNAFRPLLSPDAVLKPEMLRRLIDEAAGNIHLAAAVYDLANHAVRSGKVDQHPADHRRSQIVELLGALIQKLSRIEEGHLPEGESPETIAATISNAVALIVALTDCVALMHEETAAGKLRQAAELKHRRIQIEAAAALALMGDEWGRKKLLECASEPSIRQRAIAYAKELGIEKEVSLEYTGPIATAESYLAMWLSMPEQMGLAPTEMKLLDQRKLYWPGYEDQLECFLFEYRYGLGRKFACQRRHQWAGDSCISVGSDGAFHRGSICCICRLADSQRRNLSDPDRSRPGNPRRQIRTVGEIAGRSDLAIGDARGDRQLFWQPCTDCYSNPRGHTGYTRGGRRIERFYSPTQSGGAHRLETGPRYLERPETVGQFQSGLFRLIHARSTDECDGIGKPV